MTLWDLDLIDRQTPGTLAAVAREGRLVLGLGRVCPTWVDEAALALVEAALGRNRPITLVYPTPAGQVSVLLAAQVLLHRFLRQERTQSVGLVTAAPSDALDVWRELGVVAPGTRADLLSVFPAWRAEADGTFERQRFQGLLVGRRCKRWRADCTIIDNLAGPVFAETWGPTIRVTADPLDPLIEKYAEDGQVVWGWSEAILRIGNAGAPERCVGTPFSTSTERLETMAGGGRHEVIASAHPKAEKALRNLRDDLRTLAAGLEAGSPHVGAGMRLAWAYTSALSSLPCRPSQYDSFAGVPPIAARSTSAFAPEIAAWAESLSADHRDYASMVASDLSDLRGALDEDNPLQRAILEAADEPARTLVVCRTRTAIRAYLASVGLPPDSSSFKRLSFASMSELHREGTWERTIVVGPPPRSGWHRVDSGLSRDLRILVLGEDEAARARWALASLRAARSRWADRSLRDAAWIALIDSHPPAPPPYENVLPPRAEVVAGPRFAAEPDPYSPLGSLMVEDRPLISESDQLERVAFQQASGDWAALVPAVEVDTDKGRVVLAAASSVDVIVGDRIRSVAAEDLRAGARLVLSRREGRVGLLEALDEVFTRRRPDLVSAHILLKDYRRRVQLALLASGLSPQDVAQAMVSAGCQKDEQTVRSWLKEQGPMAPLHYDDMLRLSRVLRLQAQERELNEVFQGVRRIRGFRRSAGIALSQAAVAAAAAASDSSSRIAELETEMGLSLADLREAVIEARVVEVRRLAEPVPVASLAFLRPMEEP